ncbi:MAG: cation-translocating P-type ATPase [Clostridia bacterium]|nr:cation-translocating P-type ATPase [Clostridia bacterium]
MNKYYSMNIEDVFKATKSSKNGLSLDECQKRLVKYGKNALNEEKKPSLLKKFFNQLNDIMVIILIICGIISLSIALFFKNYNDLFEGILILVICFANALIGMIQEGKAENALNELKKQSQPFVNVRRNNKIVKINAEVLTIGDVVLLECGDIVPADIRIFFSSDQLKCDESCLTGESHAIEKDSTFLSPLDDTILSNHKNMLYAKTMIVSGHCEGVVVNIGNSTEIGKIAQNISSAKKELTPIQKSLNNLNQTLSVIILIICAIVYVVELFKGKNGILNSFLTAITLAVAAVPESLPAVISVIMAIGVGNLSKQKAIVKKLHTVETLGCCQVICTDKTGTLTLNKMEVSEIFLPAYTHSNSYTENQNFDHNVLVNCMVVNNNAKFSGNEFIGDGTEIGLLSYAKKLGINIETLKNSFPLIYEIPFSSERKMMTVLTKSKFITAFSKGSLEKILNCCSYYLCNGIIEKLSHQKKQEFLKLSSSMSKKALRVLGFAYKEFSYEPNKSLCESDMIFIGSCGLFDPPRPEAFNAIKDCKSAGLSTIMITGDSKETAFSVAKKLDICNSEKEVLTGDELSKLSDSLFSEKLENFKVFARVNPEHKTKIVKAYQNKNKIVAMTGDGINDAPSLKNANIGVSMGSGNDVAKNASDMIVTDDNFATIVNAVKEGRKIFQNIQKTLMFLFSTNLVEIITILFTSLFFSEYIFLLPSQLLFINLVTDSLPAFSLGCEKCEKDIMNLPPRKNSNAIFSKTQIAEIIIQSLYQSLILLTLYISNLHTLPIKTNSTMCFFTFSLMQINHSFNMKSSKSLFKTPVFDNKYLNFSYLFCITLNLLVAFTPLNSLFSLTPLSLSQWLVVLVLSFSIIPFVELEKFLRGVTFLFRKEK